VKSHVSIPRLREVATHDARTPETRSRLHRERNAWGEDADAVILDENHAPLMIRAGVARRLR
jgi:hypothetical protein